MNAKVSIAGRRKREKKRTNIDEQIIIECVDRVINVEESFRIRSFLFKRYDAHLSLAFKKTNIQSKTNRIRS